MQADIDLAATNRFFDHCAQAALLGERLYEVLDVSVLRAAFAGLLWLGWPLPPK